MSKNPQPKQPNTEILLEHMISNTDRRADEHSKLKEASILQHQKHKEIDHQLDEHKILLADESNKLQKEANEKLEKVIEKLSEPIEVTLEII